MNERKIPSYCLHKASGQAIVTLNGHSHYLGKYGTPESRAEYDAIIARWLAGGRYVSDSGPDPSVCEVLAAYESYASSYYRKDGEETTQMDRVRRSLAVARRLHGTMPASQYTAQNLKAVRADMVQQGLCRRLVNQRVNCLKLCFRWAAEEGMVPPTVWHGVQCVAALKAGRTEAPDHPEILPVVESDIEPVRKLLSVVLADVVSVQLLTGARPGEALAMEATRIERAGQVWLYRPRRHKTQHRRRDKIIYIGPRCQLILAPYILRHPEGYLFSPKDAMAAFRARQRAERKSRVQPSQQDRSKCDPRKQPGNRYRVTSYDRAVRTACVKAGVESWSPHQLRHNAATRIAEQFGWEVARIVLGHRSIDTTRIYAEDSLAKAIEAMLAAG